MGLARLVRYDQPIVVAHPVVCNPPVEPSEGTIRSGSNGERPGKGVAILDIEPRLAVGSKEAPMRPELSPIDSAEGHGPTVGQPPRAQKTGIVLLGQVACEGLGEELPPDYFARIDHDCGQRPSTAASSGNGLPMV
jgi:hypothetical protein